MLKSKNSRRTNVGVYAVINGKTDNKTFKTEDQAMNYISSVLNVIDLPVDEVRHNAIGEEYYCNDHTRFIVYSL